MHTIIYLLYLAGCFTSDVLYFTSSYYEKSRREIPATIYLYDRSCERTDGQHLIWSWVPTRNIVIYPRVNLVLIGKLELSFRVIINSRSTATKARQHTNVGPIFSWGCLKVWWPLQWFLKKFQFSVHFLDQFTYW